MGMSAARREYFYGNGSLLGTYRIRKIFNEWFVMVDGVDTSFSNYFQARAHADKLERQGYSDGDR